MSATTKPVRFHWLNLFSFRVWFLSILAGAVAGAPLASVWAPLSAVTFPVSS